MEITSPALLFSTAGMSALTLLLFVIQLASLVSMVFGLSAYRRITTGHKNLLSTLQRADAVVTRESFGLLPWIYIGLTISVTVLTTFIYIFQPHLL